MENAEEVFNFLEEFSKRKPKTIPQELNDYLAYVARTGDPVYQWSLVKCLFKEKLLTVITDFYETTPSIEIPPYPNVDPFNYEIMKNSLLERLDSFTSAPFTVQRICELLTYPRKQYNRIDKFMRAIEKNILVVSTREPGIQRHPEPDNGEPMEPIVNGSDNNSEYNVDVEMEDMSWKENSESHNSEPQPGSSDSHISVDDIETHLQDKPETATNSEEKLSIDIVLDTPVKSDIADKINEESSTLKSENPVETTVAPIGEETSIANDCLPKLSSEPSLDSEMSTGQETVQVITIPEIRVDDAEMTEQKIQDENMKLLNNTEESKESHKEVKVEVPEINIQSGSHISSDESSSDSTSKEESETKNISDVLTSSEESSSSSDNNEGNSNSPKTEITINIEEPISEKSECVKSNDEVEIKNNVAIICKDSAPVDQIQSDNYSISDVKSELPQVSVNTTNKLQDQEKTEPKEVIQEPDKKPEETKTESSLVNIEKSES